MFNQHYWYDDSLSVLTKAICVIRYVVSARKYCKHVNNVIELTRSTCDSCGESCQLLQSVIQELTGSRSTSAILFRKYCANHVSKNIITQGNIFVSQWEAGLCINNGIFMTVECLL